MTSPEPNILVIDDSAFEQRLLADVLEASALHSSAAYNGQQGYELALAQQPDLILMDVRMPVMDGFACCRLLKANAATRDIPVMFLSGATTDDERVQGLSIGAVDYVSKPYSAEELALRIRLQLHLAARQAQPPPEALHPDEPVLEGDNVYVAAARKLIADNLADLPAIAQIARSVGTYRERLSQLFKDQLGVTISAYIRDERIRKAKELLRTTSIDVQDIAMLTGYGNAGNFATAFREQMGVTPSAYRLRPKAVQAGPATRGAPAAPASSLPPATETPLLPPSFWLGEKELRALLAYLPEAFLMLDKYGAVRFANQLAADLFAYPADAMVGMTVRELLEDTPSPRGLLRLCPGAPQQAMARRADGAQFCAEFACSPLPPGGQRGYSITVRDISSRREGERRARATDERRRKYFVTATHELRTPMASILGFAELLLKREFKPEAARDIIGIVHGQATRLVDLINEMLDLARIEAGGKEKLDIRPRDAAALARQALASVASLGSGHTFRLDAADALPAVLADLDKLQQALLNVVGNAIKYSEQGSEISVAVFAALLPTSPAIAIQVRDQGIGMAQEQQAQVFNPFYRAGRKPDATGSGLGLTIVKEIVQLHGGAIDIESAPGIGTTVTLLIPAEQAA